MLNNLITSDPAIPAHILR